MDKQIFGNTWAKTFWNIWTNKHFGTYGLTNILELFGTYELTNILEHMDKQTLWNLWTNKLTYGLTNCMEHMAQPP